MRNRLWCCGGVLLGLVATGCARKPAVSADGLVLRRVVVYRNGVGYFERGGHVKGDRVDFRVKGSEVGDFLASLAVIEKGGSSVRSASFPIKVADRSEPAPPSPVDDERTDLPPGVHRAPPKPEAQKNKLETVVVELDGQEHDLQAGHSGAQG